jgi:hypothetical protein
MLFQSRGFGRKGSFGTASPRKKFWGAPFHGKVEDGVLTLPNAATKSYPWYSAIGNQETGPAYTRGVNGHAAIPFRGKDFIPTITRDIDEQAIDTAEGYTWKNYGLLVGTKKTLYGGPVVGPGNYTVGENAWLYGAPDGSVWKLSSADFFGRDIKVGGSITVSALRYGVLRSRDSRTVSEGDGTPIDFITTMPAMATDPEGVPVPGGTIIRHIYPGTWSLHGEKCMLYAVATDAYAPPTFTTRYGGGAGISLSLVTGIDDRGPTACWLATCSGTPGVDFAISITAHEGVYNGDVGNRNDPGVSFSSPLHQLTRFWILSWVKPDGTVEDIYFERTGWTVKISPECDPSFLQTPTVNYSGSLQCWVAPITSPTCSSIGYSVDLGGRLASEGSETVTLNYPGGTSVHTGASVRTKVTLSFFEDVPGFPGACRQVDTLAHDTQKTLDGFNWTFTQVQECIVASNDCVVGVSTTCVASTQLDCHAGEAINDFYHFNGLDSLAITIRGGDQIVNGADFPRQMVTTLGVLALPDLPNPTDGSQWFIAFDGGDAATLSLSNAYKVDPPTFLPENWVFV